MKPESLHTSSFKEPFCTIRSDVRENVSNNDKCGAKTLLSTILWWYACCVSYLNYHHVFPGTLPFISNLSYNLTDHPEFFAGPFRPFLFMSRLILFFRHGPGKGSGWTRRRCSFIKDQKYLSQLVFSCHWRLKFVTCCAKIKYITAIFTS